MHAERGELLRCRCRGDPNSVKAFDPLCFDAEFPRRANHGFFEAVYVPPHIAPVRSEIENGISDDLPRAVIGDVSAAIGGMKFDALLPEHAVRNAQILAPAIPAERDHVRVPAQKQDIRSCAGLARFYSTPLKLARRLVADAPEINQPALVRGIRHRLRISFLYALMLNPRTALNASPIASHSVG